MKADCIDFGASRFAGKALRAKDLDFDLYKILCTPLNMLPSTRSETRSSM